MAFIPRISVALGFLAALSLSIAQSRTPSVEFIRLIESSKYVENYQASAEVSARVFAARAQGSDVEYARFMNFIATTDLEDAKPCLAAVFALEMEPSEAVEAAEIYETSLGQKIISLSRKLLKETIERGQLVQPSAADWTFEERPKVVAIYQNASFRKFHSLGTKRQFMEANLACYKTALSRKHPGVKF